MVGILIMIDWWSGIENLISVFFNLRILEYSTDLILLFLTFPARNG